MRIWYRVSDLQAARSFYKEALGFTETFVDEGERWATLDRGTTEIAIGEGGLDHGDEGQVATVAVEDVKAEPARLGARLGVAGGAARAGAGRRLRGAQPERGEGQSRGRPVPAARLRARARGGWRRDDEGRPQGPGGDVAPTGRTAPSRPSPSREHSPPGAFGPLPPVLSVAAKSSRVSDDFVPEV